MSRKNPVPVLLVLTAATVATVLLAPRTPQPLSYHHFADQRPWLGIPNFGDVASNLPFAIFGVWGLGFLLGLTPQELANCFADTRERWFYVFVFLGLLLTGVGSSCYHLAPDNDRLVWDRLPMTIVFMSLVAAVIAERTSIRTGLWLWPILLAIGVLSVLQWHWSEMRGAGDLRFYAAVQVYAALVLLVMTFFPTKYTRAKELGVVVALYVIAKLLETYDKQIFAIGRLVSGHTLKHLAAALAGYWILRMLEKRRVLGFGC